ncbi:MAG: hypothetical protein LUE16_06710 [Lachnospiraceae bacterium]|nr:hypothetical protein [Lachnospiraceae bacterium]
MDGHGGVVHGFDLLRLYDGMPDETVRDYLSTLGNRTWFAGYVCTAFPMGVYFFLEKL